MFVFNPFLPARTQIMKNPVLTLAIATALATPFAALADTILYGEARLSVDYIDNHIRGTDPYWDVLDDGSKLGIKGTEDLGNGMSALYMWEFSVDMTEGGNFSGLNQKFAGLTGGFGTLTLGTQDTPYWKVLNVIDIWNSSKVLNGSAYLGGTVTQETNVNGALSTLAQQHRLSDADLQRLQRRGDAGAGRRGRHGAGNSEHLRQHRHLERQRQVQPRPVLCRADLHQA
jgi:hypothetical protein